MTTILEYYGGMEKYIIDTSIELQKRYPDLEIEIITMNNNFTENFNKFLSILFFRKYDKTYLYKETIENIKNKLGGISYVKCNSFKELKHMLTKYDVIYSKNEILEAVIFKFIIGSQ